MQTPHFLSVSFSPTYCECVAVEWFLFLEEQALPPFFAQKPGSSTKSWSDYTHLKFQGTVHHGMFGTQIRISGGPDIFTMSEWIVILFCIAIIRVFWTEEGCIDHNHMQCNKPHDTVSGRRQYFPMTQRFFNREKMDAFHFQYFSSIY